MIDGIQVPQTMQEVELYGICPVCGKLGYHDPRAMREDDHTVFKCEVKIVEEE